MPTKRPLLWSRGQGLHSVSGTIELADYADGEVSGPIEVDHSLLPTTEDPDRLAIFAVSEIRFVPVAGFIVVPLWENTGGKFRFRVECDFGEAVLPNTAEYGDGTATLSWTRVGVLADASGADYGARPTA